MKISEIDSEKIKICARTTGSRDPLILTWTGSFVEFNLKASELKLLMAGPFASYENWIAIEINGEVVARQMLSKEKQWISIFRMRNPQQLTNVRIIKEVQAFAGDAEHRLELYELETDGELQVVEDRPIKLEFIGDSITSAEGCVGAKSEMDWIASLFSHVNSYPYMVGKKLDADVRVFSQSGWGTYASWDCNPDNVIPKYYEGICSLMGTEYFEAHGFNDAWDFALWQPDAVIINLGTNDDGAFHNTECDNASLLRMVGDDYLEEDRIKVRDAMIAFLKLVRKNNPKAYIGWAFGVLGDKMESTIKEALEIYIYDSKDINAGYIKLPELTDKTVGARCHPGKKAHKEMAKVIAKELKHIIK